MGDQEETDDEGTGGSGSGAPTSGLDGRGAGGDAGGGGSGGGGSDGGSDGGDPGMDGGGLVRAFERAWSRARFSPPRAGAGQTDVATARDRAAWLLEAAAYVAALDAVGRLSSIARSDREALSAQTRRTLLSLAGLAVDPDDRDALEVAARYAREGLRVLGGAPAATRSADDHAPPPARDLVRLIRGDLDGFASADLALRLRGSARGRAELARVVPSIALPAASRLRVAADSASPGGSLRDPRDGRAVGALTVEDGALEAFSFRDGTLAVYADPPLSLSVARVSAAGSVVALIQGTRSPGYVEVEVTEITGPLTLCVDYGDRSFDWVLTGLALG